jgi:hypothetical protein
MTTNQVNRIFPGVVGQLLIRVESEPTRQVMEGGTDEDQIPKTHCNYLSGGMRAASSSDGQ